MSEAVAHLAGGEVQYNAEDGAHLRQRCAWCGATLIDVNLDRIQVPVGQEGPYPTWPVGGFVETYSPDQQGGMWASIDWVSGTPVPANACLRMPLELTG